MTGSCFSTEIGKHLIEDGFDVLLNPFGILFNPASIADSITRLESGRKFTYEDVIRRVDDASKGVFSYVSFSHHGSFARNTAELFLEDANAALNRAVEYFSEADTCILTFGTSWVFRHNADGKIVANCHKVPAREFTRELLTVEDITALYRPIITRHPEKRWILTVSPIRHTADGLHGNQVSKATLLLAEESLVREFSGQVEYFPSYEIMIDELRDHSYYAPDGSHPTAEAVEHIYHRFISGQE